MMAWYTENVFLFQRYLGTFYSLFVLKYDGQKNTF